MNAIDEYTTMLTERVTGCCGRPLWQGVRCSGCGHRQRVGGVPPVATRRLILAAGLAGPLVAWRELAGRREARRAGRH